MTHPDISAELAPDTLSGAIPIHMAAIEHAAYFDFPSRMTQGAGKMAAEEQRTRLIAEIAGLLQEGSMPADARAAGLTLIGWLARRMPGESASQVGVEEMHRQGTPPGCQLVRTNGRRPR